MENYFFPADLEAQIETFVDYYNHRRATGGRDPPPSGEGLFIPGTRFGPDQDFFDLDVNGDAFLAIFVVLIGFEFICDEYLAYSSPNWPNKGGWGYQRVFYHALMYR